MRRIIGKNIKVYIVHIFKIKVTDIKLFTTKNSGFFYVDNKGLLKWENRKAV